jgi:hypothetical protein
MALAPAFLSSLASLAALFVTGCALDGAAESTDSTASAVTTETAVSKYGLDWVLSDDGSDTIRADIFIEAPVDVVWSLLRDPNKWGDWNDALTASVPKMAPGEPISLNIRLFDPPLPPTNSPERVSVFDDVLHAESWKRDFGFGQVTDRWQLVVPEGNGTHYYTALKDPSVIGWVVDHTVVCRVKGAFVRFAEALRAESIRRAQP